VRQVVIKILNVCLVRMLCGPEIQIIAVRVIEGQRGYISFRKHVDWVVDTEVCLIAYYLFKDIQFMCTNDGEVECQTWESLSD
jgi:hypothetical protein